MILRRTTPVAFLALVMCLGAPKLGAQVFENVQFTILEEFPADAEDIDMSPISGQDPGFVDHGTWETAESSPDLLFDNDYSTHVFEFSGGTGLWFNWRGEEVQLVGILYYPTTNGPVGTFFVRTNDNTDGEFLLDTNVQEEKLYGTPVLVTFDSVPVREVTFTTAVQSDEDHAYSSSYAIGEFRLVYDQGTPCPGAGDFAYLVTPSSSGEQEAVVPGSEVQADAEAYDIAYRVDPGKIQPSEASLFLDGQDSGQAGASGYEPDDGAQISYELKFERSCQTMSIEPVTFMKPDESCGMPAWRPGETYNKSTQVSNNGIVFEARTFFLSCGDCGGPGFEQQWAVIEACGTIDCGIYPVWEHAQVYGPIDVIVSHMGKLYQAKQNQQPGLEPSDEGLEWAWEDLSDKGVACQAP